MKAILSLTAAAVLAAAWAVPAGAAQETAPAVSAAVTTDLSAAKKKRRHYRAYHPGYYAEPEPYVYGYYGYGGSDPTAAPYSNLRRQKALGRCVFDLGYGRYQLCN